MSFPFPLLPPLTPLPPPLLYFLNWKEISPHLHLSPLSPILCLHQVLRCEMRSFPSSPLFLLLCLNSSIGKQIYPHLPVSPPSSLHLRSLSTPCLRQVQPGRKRTASYSARLGKGADDGLSDWSYQDEETDTFVSLSSKYITDDQVRHHTTITYASHDHHVTTTVTSHDHLKNITWTTFLIT